MRSKAVMRNPVILLIVLILFKLGNSRFMVHMDSGCETGFEAIPSSTRQSRVKSASLNYKTSASTATMVRG